MSVTIDSTAFSIISIVIASISLFFSYVKGVKESEARFSKIDGRLVKLETQITPIWSYIDDNVGKILHSPHTPDIDAFIEKKPLNLDFDELNRFKCLLINQKQKEPDKVKKKLYGLYLGRIEGLIEVKKLEQKK